MGVPMEVIIAALECAADNIDEGTIVRTQNVDGFDIICANPILGHEIIVVDAIEIIRLVDNNMIQNYPTRYARSVYASAFRIIAEALKIGEPGDYIVASPDNVGLITAEVCIDREDGFVYANLTSAGEERHLPLLLAVDYD